MAPLPCPTCQVVTQYLFVTHTPYPIECTTIAPVKASNPLPYVHPVCILRCVTNTHYREKLWAIENNYSVVCTFVTQSTVYL